MYYYWIYCFPQSEWQAGKCINFAVEGDPFWSPAVNESEHGSLIILTSEKDIK